MTRVSVTGGLILLLSLGVVYASGASGHPLPSDKQNEAKPTTQAKNQEGKAVALKSAGDKAAPTDLYGDPLPSGAIARLGTVRFRHRGSLEDVLFMPDGRSLISGGNSSIDWWDAQSGRRLRQVALAGTRNRLVGIDLSPDGKLLAVQYYLTKMRFWNPVTGVEVHPFGDNGPGGGRAKFSPRGDLLALHEFGNQRKVGIWDISKGKKIRTIEGAEPGFSAIRSIASSPDGKLLAFPRATGVCVWDVEANKALHQLDPGAKSPMGRVVFSPDGKLLIAACSFRDRGPDHAIHLWDLATGKEVGTLKGHGDGYIRVLAMSPNGDLLASLGFDRTIRFWDVAKRKEIGRSTDPAQTLMSLAFSRDGNMLVSGEANGVIRLWDTRTHQELPASAAMGNCVQWVSFAPDGRTLISTVPGQIGLWDPLIGRPIHLFNSPHLSGFRVALSPDGKNLATTSDGTQAPAQVWDVPSGKRVRQLGESNQPRITSVTYSPDGRRVAGGSTQGDIIHVWDAATGKELLQLKGGIQCSRLAFSPDGETLAASSGWVNTEMDVRLWKLSTGEEIWRGSTRPWLAFDLTFSPDGRTLALGGAMPGRLNVPGELRLWEAATGKELKRVDGNRLPVRCLSFSSDGRMLAAGTDDDNTVRLWEVATWQERQRFPGHQNAILAVSFSPDGRLLASSSYENSGLVWDLTGRFRDGHFQPRRLSSEELGRCWIDLAHTDASRAYRSIVALWGSPTEAVALLKIHLSPMTTADSKRVAPLLAALDSDRFDERDKSMAELEKLGLAAEPALSAALDAKPSLEKRQRIEAIQEKLVAGPRLRLLRAFETLEHIATPEARQVLETVSKGSAELWPTREAKASLARLSARPALRP